MSRKSKNKKVKLEITYSWTFNEVEWGDAQNHWKEVKLNPRIIQGQDSIDCWNIMNDVVYPDLERVKLNNVE
jgi:hypothetical protein|tara:strand:- start:282 stop:497 length:216 start_codon:yes stop_codon:yes gene_type:complete